jgi:cytochrome c
MGMAMSSLEEVVNTCIEKPLKGKALDTNSQEMQDVVAYIKSLGK